MNAGNLNQIVEIKQNTGIEACQCRKRRSQRNHIACSLLVWVFLKEKAYSLVQNVYQLKQAPLKDYLKKIDVKSSSDLFLIPKSEEVLPSCLLTFCKI